MVLKILNSRMTFASRLALLSAVLMAPLVLLTALFVRQSWQEIALIERELEGVRYLSATWPEFNAAAAAAPVDPSARLSFDVAARKLDPRFGTRRASARFIAAATPAAKAEAGASLITEVADSSSLTLDTDLDTYYLMEATTVRLPALTRAATEFVQASAAGGAPLEGLARQAAARDRVQVTAAAAEAALAKASARAPVETRNALARRISSLEAAADGLVVAAAVPPNHGGSHNALAIGAAERRLQGEIDATWRASTAELTRLLQARQARLLARLWLSLAFVVLFIAASVAIARAIAHGLAVRVRDLTAAMKSLTAGDLTVDIPYRADPSEIGDVAGGVEAFKRASADRARLMIELEAAYGAMQEYQSWLKMALAAGRMGAWRRRLPEDLSDFTPELTDLAGLPKGTKPTIADVVALSLDPEVMERWAEEARLATAGEIDELAAEDVITAFRRPDTGEVRWVMLRRELVIDPARGSRDIVGVAIDITERKHLMDELNHRVKNNLATVLSLAMQTAKSTEDLNGFMKAFTDRIQALSRINELVTRHGWGQIKLREVLAVVLRPWLDAGVELMPGSPEHTVVSSRAAVSLCLVLNEMAADAVQHGALAAEGGRVEIAWAQPDPEHAALTWVERSRLTIAPSTGFRATLIQRLVTGDLGGSADLDYRPHGLAATINFTLAGATA